MLCNRWLVRVCGFFVCKQKTADEMRISDWSSDVCSSDLEGGEVGAIPEVEEGGAVGHHLLAVCGVDLAGLDAKVGVCLHHAVWSHEGEFHHQDRKSVV